MRRGSVEAGALALALAVCFGSAEAFARGCIARPGAAPLELDRRSATRLLVSEPRPDYPPLARINYIGGGVAVRLTVNCRGRVQHAHVVHGQPLLAAAALQAIKRWVYRPLVTRTGPATFQTTVKVNFSLLGNSLRSLPPDPAKFLARSVRPPRPPKEPALKPGEPFVRVRVLVSDAGAVIDCTQLSGTSAQFEVAQKKVEQWRFKPARWGNLEVPWYAEVRVPVGNTPEPAALDARLGDAESK